MFYPEFTSDHKTISYIEYYRELRAKYGDRYYGFDPTTILSVSQRFAKKTNYKKSRPQMKKVEEKLSPKDRRP